MSGVLSYLQYQALFLWLVLAAGWTWSGLNRRRERIRRLLAAKATARKDSSPSPRQGATVTRCADGGADSGDVAAAPRHPPVSVVMPVKGCRPHSAENWTSHLGLQYGGPLEFLFVVESEDDPAVGPLRELMRRFSGRPVRLVVAGRAATCSQKAHNLCAGIESCDPRVARDRGYVLCLDDDVGLHPGTLRELVGDLEARPGVFMATGYPFDVPPPGSSLPAYLALSYHLPLLIAFSVAPDTSFVWGGCMLLRGERLLPDDPGGLLAAWRNGGYSDDLILASYCTERGLGIRVPPFAVFPQRLDPNMSWAAWLNYLHRQLFVLDTYTNEHNRKTNHTMVVLHSMLSWLLVLPSLAAVSTLVIRLAAAAVEMAAAAAAAAASSASTGISAAAGSSAAGTGGGGGGSPEAHQGLHVWGSGAAAAAAVCSALQSLPGGVVAVAAGWAVAHLALVFMTAEILALFRQLSPASPPIPLSWFKWGRLWWAMMASNAVLPLVMGLAYWSPRVEWGGVVYRKHRGKVAPVGRRHPQPP